MARLDMRLFCHRSLRFISIQLLIIEFQCVHVKNQRKIVHTSLKFCGRRSNGEQQQESCSLYFVNARSPWQKDSTLLGLIYAHFV